MYRAPVEEIAFTLKEVAGLEPAVQAGKFGDLSADLVDAILAEAGRFASEEVAPLYKAGDERRRRARWRGGHDAAGLEGALPPLDRGRLELADRPRGIRRAGPADDARRRHARNVELGLAGLRALPDAHHGRGRGARQARLRRAEADLSRKARFGRVDRHDEPDRAAGRLRPRPRCAPAPSAAGDGTYRIFGQKIFITYGEQDLTENIVHLVLARLPDAPPGTRGISLFLVPKFLVDERRLARPPQRPLLRRRSSTSSASTARRPAR